MSKIFKLTTNDFIIIGILVLLGFAGQLSAWTPPVSSPIGGNTLPPINIGNGDQRKNGGLGLGALAVNRDTVFIGNLKIQSGEPGKGKILVAIDRQGNARWASRD